jgi:hypothetical protein
MWAEAARWVAKFPEGVVNTLDGAGYPVSVRQLALPYDAGTGTMAVVMPESLGAVAGPASLVCHFHDEKMWSLRSILLKGRLERREGGWQFVTTSFTPPSMWKMIKGVRQSTRQYLQKRGLAMPKVDYAVIERLWERARKITDP